jgi:hypothetical protein
MKKVIIISILIILVMFGVAVVTAFKIGLIPSPFDRVVVRNDKYGFQFSYVKERGLVHVDEWDNGLPGSQDGGVYGYGVTGDNLGAFTPRKSFSIYNRSLDDYLSNFDTSKGYWKVEDVNKFWRAGKKVSNIEGNLASEWGGIDVCEYVFEKNDLLYIVDCDISDFKFLR